MVFLTFGGLVIVIVIAIVLWTFKNSIVPLLYFIWLEWQNEEIRKECQEEIDKIDKRLGRHAK